MAITIHTKVEVVPVEGKNLYKIRIHHEMSEEGNPIPFCTYDSADTEEFTKSDVVSRTMDILGAIEGFGNFVSGHYYTETVHLFAVEGLESEELSSFVDMLNDTAETCETLEEAIENSIKD